MKLKKLLLITLGLFFFGQINAEVIKNIQISGLNAISRGTVLNYLPIEINDDFNESNSSKILEALYETNFFEKIDLNIKNSNLIINVVENPVIKYFDFKNYDNGAVLDDELVEQIKKNSNLVIGKTFNKKSLNKLLNELKNLYQSNAFYGTQINVKTTIDSRNRIGIELEFIEGEPSLIGEFKISGNEFFETDSLEDLFDMGEADFFIINYFTENDRFDKRKFNAGIESVKSKYIDSGFLDIKFSKTEVKLFNDKSNISIDIEIDEGPRYKINDIAFTGDISNFNETYLLNLMSINAGDFFSRKKITKGLENIRELFSNNGYAYASVDTKVLKSNNPQEFELIIDIKKEHKVYVNRIEINGNNKTQDDVIRREMLIREGQIYSQSEINESIKRIKRLGFFSKVNHITQAVDQDMINIKIDVEETKTGEFTIGLSHSNATGPAFSTGISQSNILGTGNTFNGKFINSSAISELSFYFSNPYFTENGEELNYGLFNKTTDASNLDVGSYNIDESGFSLGYGIPIDGESDLNGDMRFSSISLSCGSVFSTSDYEQAQCANPDVLDSNFSLSYLHNSLNDFYSPTNGSKHSLKTSLSIPIGDLKYYSIEGSSSKYFPLKNQFTFHSKANLKLAQGYGNSKLPFYKRYYGGGSSSVRGFDFNSLGSKYPDGKAKGGELSFLTSSAIIAPGSKVGISNQNIRVSGFIDAGGISDELNTFDFNDVRASAGLALSWLTPVGPIGIHLSEPILEKDGDNTETFSFQLGTSF